VVVVNVGFDEDFVVANGIPKVTLLHHLSRIIRSLRRARRQETCLEYTAKATPCFSGRLAQPPFGGLRLRACKPELQAASSARYLGKGGKLPFALVDHVV
jgi:hypothetical protein